MEDTRTPPVQVEPASVTDLSDSYPPPPPCDPRLRVAMAWLVAGAWPTRRPIALLEAR